MWRFSRHSRLIFQPKRCNSLFHRPLDASIILSAFTEGRDDLYTKNGVLVLDGKKTADAIRSELKQRVLKLKKDRHRAPGLAVVLVGNRPDSATYVRMKKKACKEVGINDFGIAVDEDISQEELVERVKELNENPMVDGILVQLPLPPHINEKVILSCISVDKDADGLHPTNAGYLCLRGYTPTAMACTPKGCLELLHRYNIPISGKNVVILGRSNIVGIPMCHAFLEENATVTVCHSYTKNVQELVGKADILVVAIGQKQFVKGEWLKPGAVIIDVGINTIPDPSKKSGYRLVGDVDFASAVESGKVAAISPVPGGVGPMTIAMLLQNTIESAERRLLTKK